MSLKLEKQEGKLPDNWERVSLSEVCSFGGGKTPRKSNESYWGGTIPWVSPKDFNGVRMAETEDKLTEQALKESSIRLYPSGSIAMVVRSGVLKHSLPVSRLDIEAAVNQDIKVLRPKSDRITEEYLLSILTYEADRIRTSCAKTGTTVESIETAFLKEYKIPLPPLSEQRRIADILSTIDEQKRQTDNIIEELKELRTGTQRNLYKYGFYDHNEISTRRLIEAPNSWNIEPLSKFTEESSYGPRFSSEKYDESGRVATLRTTDVEDDGNIIYENMPLADLDPKEFSDHLLKEGDFVISRSGNCGRCAVWGGYDVPTVPGAYMIRFRLTNRLNPRFLRDYANGPVGSKRVDILARGSTQKNLAGSDLLSMMIPVPSREEQDKIVEVESMIKERIWLEQEHKQELQELKRGVMQDLLTGKIRVNTDN